MTLARLAVLLSASCFFTKILPCGTKNKRFYSLIFENKTSLARQRLESESPPQQMIINTSLVYASGCVTILKTEEDGPWGLEQAEMVAILLEHGADPNYINKKVCNRTALQMAACKGRLNTVRMLLAHGADIYSGFEKKQDALTEACSHRHPTLVSELLMRGSIIAPQHSNLTISDEQKALPLQRTQAIFDLLRNQTNLPNDLIRHLLTFDGTSSLWHDITKTKSE